jgi:hypothetical protein
MAELKVKKKSIPKVMKDLCWSKYVGDTVGKTRCACCETNDIKMNDFQCGHVIAEANGGKTTIDNLRPICKACNVSMGIENLNEFKIRCGFGKVAASPTPAVLPQSPVDEVVTWDLSMAVVGNSASDLRPKYLKVPLNTPVLSMVKGILQCRGYIFNQTTGLYELK